MSSKITYIKNVKYQTTKDCSFQLSKVRPPKRVYTLYISLETDGMLYIKRGYAWDGASGPTIDTKSSMRASLIHDSLFQAMRLGLLHESFKEVVDQEFKMWLLRDNMHPFRAYLWLLGLKWFAKEYQPKYKKKEYTVP